MATAFGSAADTLQNTLDSAIEAVISALGSTPGLGDRANIPTTTRNTSLFSGLWPPDFWTSPLNDPTRCPPNPQTSKDDRRDTRTVDPRLPTLRLADETILTLRAQFELAVGTRTAGLLARGFQAADLFGFTNTNAINKTTVHFYLQIDNGAHYRCTVGNKVLAFERG